jgi:hypothetical protein
MPPDPPADGLTAGNFRFSAICRQAHREACFSLQHHWVTQHSHIHGVLHNPDPHTPCEYGVDHTFRGGGAASPCQSNGKNAVTSRSSPHTKHAQRGERHDLAQSGAPSACSFYYASLLRPVLPSLGAAPHQPRHKVRSFDRVSQRGEGARGDGRAVTCGSLPPASRNSPSAPSRSPAASPAGSQARPPPRWSTSHRGAAPGAAGRSVMAAAAPG